MGSAPVTFTMALHLPRDASSPRSCAGVMACHAGRRSTSRAGIRSPRSPAQRATYACKVPAVKPIDNDQMAVACVMPSDMTAESNAISA